MRNSETGHRRVQLSEATAAPRCRSCGGQGVARGSCREAKGSGQEFFQQGPGAEPRTASGGQSKVNLWKGGPSEWRTFGRFMDVSPPGRFTPSQDVSPPGRFATWTFCPQDVSPPGRFATWAFRPLDVPPPGRFATWTFRPRLWLFRPRQWTVRVRPRL